MKKLLLISTLILGFVFAGFSQEQTFNLPITFKADAVAKVWFGKAWNGEYEKMDGSSAKNIVFDGKVLNIYFDSGRTFWKTNVISYQKKEDKNSYEVKKISYILKIKDEGYIKYVIISKDFDNYYTDIRIPYLDKLGEVFLYNYYQRNDF